MTGLDWRTAAACRDHDPELFFPPVLDKGGPVSSRHPSVAPAVAVCRSCPVEQECLDAANDTAQAHGVWGGLTPYERSHGQRESRRSPHHSGRENQRWSDGDIRLVAQLAAAGMDDHEIGTRLGRTSRAVENVRNDQHIRCGRSVGRPVRSTI